MDFIQGVHPVSSAPPPAPLAVRAEDTGWSSTARGTTRAMMRAMSNGTRAYRFVVEYVVEPDHPAYDDPEWAADAAWGALTNMYGLLSSCTSIEEIDPREALKRS